MSSGNIFVASIHRSNREYTAVVWGTPLHLFIRPIYFQCFYTYAVKVQQINRVFHLETLWHDFRCYISFNLHLVSDISLIIMQKCTKLQPIWTESPLWCLATLTIPQLVLKLWVCIFITYMIVQLSRAKVLFFLKKWKKFLLWVFWISWKYGCFLSKKWAWPKVTWPLINIKFHKMCFNW